MGHSSWGEQLKSNEEAGINRLGMPGLVSWLLPQLSPEHCQRAGDEDQAWAGMGEIGILLLESYCDGISGLLWGRSPKRSSACLS